MLQQTSLHMFAGLAISVDEHASYLVWLVRQRAAAKLSTC